MTATKRKVIDPPTQKSNGDMRKARGVTGRPSPSGNGAPIHKPLRKGKRR